MTQTQGDSMTYRIEVRDGGQWIPAPGDSSGWTYDDARRAVDVVGLVWLDGTPISPDDIRIVPEA